MTNFKWYVLLLLASVLLAARNADAELPPNKNEGLMTRFRNSMELQQQLSSFRSDERPRGGTIGLPRRDVALQQYLRAHLEFQDAKSRQEFGEIQGVHAFSEYREFMDAFISGDQATIAAVDNFKKLKALESAGVVELPPPSSPKLSEEKSRQVPDDVVLNGFQRLTGKGVTIAILDTGVDFRHPDFITYKNGQPTSRLLYFWDINSDLHLQGIGSPAPITYPDGSSIGTIFSQSELTAELRSGNQRIRNPDAQGHGTACAGVAAGNGNASQGKYAGVAPEADLIAVGLSTETGGALGVQEVYVGAVCDWLDKVSGSKPLVVSNSWGGHGGGHDGMRVIERQLSSRFPLDSRGRAICFAAGNEGSAPIHADLKFGPGAPMQLTWNCKQAGCLMQIYMDSDDQDWSFLVGGGISQSGWLINSLTGKIVLWALLEAGPGSVDLVADGKSSFAGDAYMTATVASFSANTRSFSEQVSSPSTGTNVLSVGSYDWNDQFDTGKGVLTCPDGGDGNPIRIGHVSRYSCPGPLRGGGSVKPEVVAPGQWFAAPAAQSLVDRQDLPVDVTGKYTIHNGTSAATPYVAGIIALAFEQNPQRTFGEIREMLIRSASHDDKTGKTPNPNWGHGKIDQQAVNKFFSAGNSKRNSKVIGIPKGK